MRIAVNTRLLLPGKLDGIGWFSFEILRRIVLSHPEHSFFFLFDRKPDPQFIFAPNVKPIVLFPQARHPLLWYLFFECSVPLALRRHHIDLLLSPDGYIPLHSPVPSVNVIHDINFAHFPNNLRPSHQRYMSHFFPLFARKASHIVTVSQFSKQDISSTYNIPLSKISVVYNSAGSNYHPLPPDTIASIQSQYSHGKPYFIFISTILRRKNLANLLLAFDRFKDSNSSNHNLLVVGSRVWWQDELKAAYDSMRHQDSVIFIGRAEADLLAKLLASATALVYPSFFEGFGIPIIEAFQTDTPVITSNTTSMPEVAGDAAILVDPHSVDQLSNALSLISSNLDRRNSLIQRGRSRRSLFSWDKSAQSLWDIMMKTLSNA